MSTLQIIAERLTKALYQGFLSENALRQEGNLPPGTDWLATLTEGEQPGTFRWPDIDYTGSILTHWQVSDHYVRLLHLVKEKGPERLKADPDYQAKAIGALAYWLENDFQNPGWWHNEIGTPRNIADLVLMMRDVLPDPLLHKALEIMARGSMKTNERVESWTGANLVWGGSITLRHALLTGDTGLLVRAVARIGRELDYLPEGIQPDGSFFQHGARFYSGGYGRSFACDLALLIWALKDTEFQFPRAGLEIFMSHILDGLQHMTQGHFLDYACVGREFTRKGMLDATGLGKHLALLLEVPQIPRHEELAGYLHRMSGGNEEWKATRFYPHAMLVTHHGRGLYFGIKCLSDRILCPESCNHEGDLFYNMSYGGHTCIMRKGDEYADICPIWDYAAIPGTTARPQTDDQLLAHPEWKMNTLPSSISGGMEKDGLALIYEKAEHDGISAKISFFVFDGRMVALGADITDEKGGMLQTTVNQCWARGEVIEKEGALFHDGIAYYNLDPDTTFQYTLKTVTGSWHRNNFGEPDDPVTGEVFTLTIPCDPSRHSAYAYAVCPEGTRPGCQMLSNDGKMQAIRLEDGTVMGVDYEKGECYIR